MKTNTDIYKIGYRLITSLDYKDPKSSIGKATRIIERSLSADTAMLLKKNENEKFDLIAVSNDKYTDELRSVVDIYNKKRKRDLDIAIDDENIKRLMILNIPVNDDMYALVVTNGISLKDNKESIAILKQSIRNIIINSELVYRLRLSSTFDSLTNIRNRNSYEQDKAKFLEDEETIITFIIADLLRLKHINDSYGHSKGDKYIKETARILKDLFEKDGSRVYRLGGDEFAIITTNNDLDILDIELNEARERVSNIKLNIGDEPLRIDFGAACGSSHKIEKLYKYADRELSINKEQTYKKLNLERRG